MAGVSDGFSSGAGEASGITPGVASGVAAGVVVTSFSSLCTAASLSELTGNELVSVEAAYAPAGVTLTITPSTAAARNFLFMLIHPPIVCSYTLYRLLHFSRYFKLSGSKIPYKFLMVFSGFSGIKNLPTPVFLPDTGGFSFVSFLFVYGSRSVDFCLKSGNSCREIRNKHLALAGIQIIVRHTALYNIVRQNRRQLTD